MEKMLCLFTALAIWAMLNLTAFADQANSTAGRNVAASINKTRIPAESTDWFPETVAINASECYFNSSRLGRFTGELVAAEQELMAIPVMNSLATQRRLLSDIVWFHSMDSTRQHSAQLSLITSIPRGSFSSDSDISRCFDCDRMYAALF